MIPLRMKEPVPELCVAFPCLQKCIIVCWLTATLIPSDVSYCR